MRKNLPTNIYPFIEHLKGKSSQVLLFLLFLLLFATACKDESGSAGLVVDPAVNPDAIVKSDFEIKAFTFPADSISTDSLSGNLLGAIVDPAFGNYRSTLFTQLRLKENDFSFPGSAVLDSVVLSLQFAEGEENLYYGDNSPLEINVYRLTEALSLAENYYQNDNTQAESTPLGSKITSFNFEDSITLVENKITINQGPQVRIPLSQALGNEILSADETVFSSNELFQDFLKGLKIEAEYPAAGGVLANILLGGASSRLVVYYDDTSALEFPINISDVAYCRYEQSNRPADLENQIANPDVHYNTTYIQAMGSSRLKIRIPDLLDFAANEDVVIHEALLQLKVKDGTATQNYFEPPKLNLFVPDKENARNAPIQDYIDLLLGFPYARYGGDYLSEIDGYQFWFTRQLQQMIEQHKNGETNVNRGFYVTIPSSVPLIGSRLVLNTDNSIEKNLIIKVAYTKLNK